MIKFQTKKFSENKKLKSFRISLSLKFSYACKHYQVFCLNWRTVKNYLGFRRTSRLPYQSHIKKTSLRIDLGQEKFKVNLGQLVGSESKVLKD